jgi:hypothetical protein
MNLRIKIRKFKYALNLFVTHNSLNFRESMISDGRNLIFVTQIGHIDEEILNIYFDLSYLVILNE